MKLFSIFWVIFIFTVTVNSEYNYPLKSQKELKVLLLNADPNKVESNLKILKAIQNYSILNDSIKETKSYFLKLLKNIRFKPLYSSIYSTLAEYESGSEKLRILKNAFTYAKKYSIKVAAQSRVIDHFIESNDNKSALNALMVLLKIQQQRSDFSGIAETFFKMGSIYHKEINFLRALEFYYRAIDRSKRKNSALAGKIYLRISEIFSIVRRQSLSENYLKRAEEISKKLDDHKLRADINLFLSVLTMKKSQYSDALNYIESAIKIIYDNKIEDDISPFLQSKANILYKLKKNRLAVDMMAEIVDDKIEKRKFNELLIPLTQLLKWLIERREFKKSLYYLEKFDDIFAPYYKYYFFYHYIKGLYYEKVKSYSDAAEYYQKAVVESEVFFRNAIQNKYLIHTVNIDQMYNDINLFFVNQYFRTNHISDFKMAISLNELRNHTVHKLVSNSFFSENYLKRVNQVIQKHTQKESEIEKSLTQLKTEFSKKYQRFQISKLNIEQVQKSLSENQIIIKYIILNRLLYAIKISKTDREIIILSKEVEKVAQMVNHLTVPLDDFTIGKVDYLRVNYNLQTAFKLYKLILEPLLASEKKIDELFIIPDGFIYKVPIDALVTEFRKKFDSNSTIFSEYKSVKYFIESYRTSYYFSLFHFNGSSLKRKTIKNRLNVSLFGDPVSDSEEKWYSSFLPSSKNEIQKIENILKNENVKSYIKKGFTIDNFLENASDSDIIHIATHYFVNEKYPQYSALMFSGNRKRERFFHAKDFFNLKLNCKLFFISACESSEKSLLGLEGIKGLISNLRYSGAKSVVVSLWPVDEFSSKLAPQFYEELNRYKIKGNRFLKIENSLRNAKLKMMHQYGKLDNGTIISFAHPFIWANFVVFNLN